MWIFLLSFVVVALSIECNPDNDCKQCRQCDRNIVECTQKANEQTDVVHKQAATCRCFASFFNCVELNGCLYIPNLDDWCSVANISDTSCSSLCDNPIKIGRHTPETVEFGIFNEGSSLTPKCSDSRAFDEDVELGKCLTNDEFGNYRLDIVDGFVSRSGPDGTKKIGLKIQYQFGCQVDESGECYDCGDTGEVAADDCDWGCQKTGPESGCHSFWFSGFDSKYNPYSEVALNVTCTVNKQCGDGTINDFVDRILSEGSRTASLYADTSIRDWNCVEIPPKTDAKRQTTTQISYVWVDFGFTGDSPRAGAEAVRALYAPAEGGLQTLGGYEGVTVETVSVNVEVYSVDQDPGLSGAAIFGIIVLVVAILVILGIAGFFVYNRANSAEYA